MFEIILIAIVFLLLVVGLSIIGLVFIKINETLVGIRDAINNHKGGTIL